MRWWTEGMKMISAYDRWQMQHASTPTSCPLAIFRIVRPFHHFHSHVTRHFSEWMASEKSPNSSGFGWKKWHLDCVVCYFSGVFFLQMLSFTITLGCLNLPNGQNHRYQLHSWVNTFRLKKVAHSTPIYSWSKIVESIATSCLLKELLQAPSFFPQ